VEPDGEGKGAPDSVKPTMGDLFDSEGDSDEETEAPKQSSDVETEPAAEKHTEEGGNAEKEMEDLFGSDGDEEEAVPKQAASEDKMEDLFGSDDEDQVEGEEKVEANMEDLFGSDDSEGEGGDVAAKEGGGGVPGEEVKPVQEPLAIEVADLPPMPEGARLVSVRVPQFLGINQKPFVKEEFRAMAEAAERAARSGDEPEAVDPDEEQVGEIMRWRYRELSDGTKVPESNTRIIEWSDGSRTLQIGSEMFDLKVEKNAPHTGLWARHDGVQNAILECHGWLTDKYTVRPTGLNAKTHQSLAAAASNTDWKQRDKSRVKVYQEGVLVDPEKAHAAREKARDEELRSKQQYGEGGMGRSQPSGGRVGMSYYDESRETSFGRGGRHVDESKLLKAKDGGMKRKADDDDSISDVSEEEEDNGFIVNDEEDEEDEAVVKRLRKKAKNNLDDDDDDDD